MALIAVSYRGQAEVELRLRNPDYRSRALALLQRSVDAFHEAAWRAPTDVGLAKSTAETERAFKALRTATPPSAPASGLHG
ncbi:hypothetical protein SBA3_3140007 [Candidatus Sulfopaludibacter sp. SbA3]|nr:hypothetical protein SBA3_3140007 [Candidatus Sulfopaludibacter sp. SbA3]